MSMLKKLLRYPHAAVFDKAPAAEVAFRMNSPRGLTWQVRDEVLTVRLGTDSLDFSLADHTIGSLIAELRSFGIMVERESPRFFGRSASVLAEGSGDASTPQGDILVGFTSLLWVLYAAYALELRTARGQVREALRQMVITQAEGEWLDVWGQLYGVPRDDDETDAELQQRLPREVTRLRINKIAIEETIYELTGNRIYLRETWKQMFRLDESRMSWSDRMVDGASWRYGYIQPYAKTLFDWGDTLEIIHRNKAAGVVVLQPVAEIDLYVDGKVLGDVSFGISATMGAMVRPTFDFRLDYLRLSATQPHRNWTGGNLVEMGIMNIVKAGTWASVGGKWRAEPWSSWTDIDNLDGTVGSRHLSTIQWISGRSWSDGGSWSRING